MNILIFGGSGLLGIRLTRQALLSHGQSHNIVATYNTLLPLNRPLATYEQLQVTDAARVRDIVLKTKPDAIINTVSLTNVDWCEEHEQETVNVNVGGMKNIIAAAKELGSNPFTVFVSSDYVFDGKNGPYETDAKPNPLNVYGRSKLAAEEELKNSGLPYLIARSTVIYGWHYKINAAMRAVQSLRKNEMLRVPIDQYGNPTLAENCAEALVEAVEKKLEGVMHVTGSDCVNRYDFTIALARVFGLDEKLVEGTETLSLKQKAVRPLKSGFIVNKTQARLKTRLLSMQEGLEKFKLLEKEGITG